ncbi:MAG: hypothetical protein ACI8ZN_000960 [Bacteroidia bacterium]|jgi:hypothetical protein
MKCIKHFKFSIVLCVLGALFLMHGDVKAQSNRYIHAFFDNDTLERETVGCKWDFKPGYQWDTGIVALFKKHEVKYYCPSLYTTSTEYKYIVKIQIADSWMYPMEAYDSLKKDLLATGVYFEANVFEIGHDYVLEKSFRTANLVSVSNNVSQYPALNAVRRNTEYEYSITNMIGEVVDQGSFVDKLNIFYLNGGVYFISVFDKSNREYQRVKLVRL